ncbi:hypothetical protein [Streptomyces sp. NPDC058751]|uniref:hypothetical protein n=1 Tax=Streptomyces sp. NPDC058751 TaxID=3346623 RepID=UPI00368B656B
MTSAELVPGRAPAVRSRPRAEADVRTRGGERISASAARKLINAVPENSRDARDTRLRSYRLWCATCTWAGDEPNAVASYLPDLGDRGHPAKSLEAHFATLCALRAIHSSPLSDGEIKACRLIVRHRAGEEADDPPAEPGPLQADAVTLPELRRMVHTADRTTARGKQIAVTPILDWWTAARTRHAAHAAAETSATAEDATTVWSAGTRPGDRRPRPGRRARAGRRAGPHPLDGGVQVAGGHSTVALRTRPSAPSWSCPNSGCRPPGAACPPIGR